MYPTRPCFWVNDDKDNQTLVTGKYTVDANIRIVDAGGPVGGSGVPLSEITVDTSFTLPCEPGSNAFEGAAATLTVRIGFFALDVTAELTLVGV